MEVILRLSGLLALLLAGTGLRRVGVLDAARTELLNRTAAMTLHLGEKTKWRCPDCGYGYVEIDGINTLPA